MAGTSAGTIETTSPTAGRASSLMRAVNTNLRSLSADLGRTDRVAYF